GGINLVMTPIAGSGGTFGTAIANVTVNTSNTTGYTFTMNTETTDTDLKNSKVDYTTHPDQKITNLTTTTTATDFPLNKWGYNVHKAGTYIKGAANTYVPVPNSSSSDADRQIEVTDAAGSNNYTFAYGVKANLNLPSGDYNTTLVFSATANPLPTMQDFDYTACQALTADQTVTLYDSRDDTPYTVAKLADGNCWMTQNLALGGSSAMTLTPANTNIATNFTLPASTAEGSWTGSYDDPELFDYAGNYPSQQASNKYGNFYNWVAATAGSGGSSGDAQYSICPKNWRLPSASNAYTTSEQYAMINNYITTGTWHSGTYPNWTGVTTTNFTNTPASLVFSGSYYDDLYDQGNNGGWWSSTASDSDNAHDLSVTSNGIVYPRTNFDMSGGLSVRCLIKPTANIVYDSNSATSNNGIAAIHENVEAGDTIELFPGNDYKTDYGFAGWSTDPNAGSKVSSSDDSVRDSVKVYGPMETVTVTRDLIDASVNGTTTLYAVWVPSAGSMQSFDATACSNLDPGSYSSGSGIITPGQITARKDSRDNNTYAIAKLTDGRCWMIENLRLDQNIALNSSNTQNPSIATTPANDTSSWSGATANKLRNDNISAPTTSMSVKTGNTYSYGVYYTWYTATAGRNPSSGNTTGSICPYNWSMPISNTTTTVGSFGYLASTMGSTSDTATATTNFRHYPNNFLYSGLVRSGSVNSRGSSGNYWSRTATNSSNAYILSFIASSFAPSSLNNKNTGYSIRCISGS
ncbi:hypothetical protein IKF33_02210, partial [Candidatus Saccharibacteria bacterium]|nr:hypothetical protein [Candidatus Saccharibacteria bacterium]